MMAQRCPDGEPVDEIYVCATLCCVLAAGFVTDTIGIHALFGAFVVGILVPKEGAFAGALVEKVEDLVSACFGKIVGTVVVSLLCKMPFQEALAVGFLMNTKGLVELIVLNIGRDRKVIQFPFFFSSY
ncbi:unnamed protein product [Linum tenue]|nr:unnamed protein product [Linum tenue]